MNTALIACSLLTTGVAAPVPRELENPLHGAWVEVSAEGPPGTVAPEPMSWTFEKGTVTVRPAKGGGKGGLARTLDVDGGKSPKAITLTVAHGGRMWVQRGIYKLDGDRLTIFCLGVAVGDAAVNESGRPTAFKSGGDGV